MSFSHWWLQQGKVLHFISKRFGGVVEKKNICKISRGEFGTTVWKRYFYFSNLSWNDRSESNSN